MSNILAIDPGTTESAVAVWNGKSLLYAGKIQNESVFELISNSSADVVVCEQICSYGMAVGAEVFETVFWTGRFAQFCKESEFIRVPRREVKMHLCGSMKAKDANIIQALKDRFGDKPKKGHPSPVYGDHKLAADEWQAFALAVTYYDTKCGGDKIGRKEKVGVEK